jgi:sugar phosphate isomerase/epimerase
MSIAERLGVQSYCYRGFRETDAFLEKVRRTGLDRIEVWGGHVDFSDDEAVARFLARCRESGVQPCSMGVVAFANDEPAERQMLQFASKAGTPYVSCDLRLAQMPDCLRTAERLADELDLKLMIHNHGGRHWLGSAQALEWVFSQASPCVGLCLDTAWAMHAHEDPIAMVETFDDRLFGVHLKDFVFDRAGRHEDVVVGTGNLELGRLRQALERIGFEGPAVLEYEADVDNPVPALVECVERIRKCMS